MFYFLLNFDINVKNFFVADWSHINNEKYYSKTIVSPGKAGTPAAFAVYSQ